MEARTRLAIGGVTTVAASVAVVCAVAITNNVALSETAGSPVEAVRVVVPSSGIIAAAEYDTTPAPALSDAPPSRTPSPQPPPPAEIVPAPAPEVIAPSRHEPAGESPRGGQAEPDEKAAVAEARATGSWESVRDWAARLGWSADRIDAWVMKLESAHGSVLDEWKHDRGSGGNDDHREVHDDSAARTGSRENTADMSGRPKTAAPKERPAYAGANAERWAEKPGFGAKKDRSRVSPDRRD